MNTNILKSIAKNHFNYSFFQCTFFGYDERQCNLGNVYRSNKMF